MRISKLIKDSRDIYQKKPIVCITMGYPAGIGPEIVAKILAKPSIRKLASFLVIGDRFVFDKAAALVNKKLSYQVINNADEADFSKNTTYFPDSTGKYRATREPSRSKSCNIWFLDLNNVQHKDFRLGTVSGLYGKASIEYIDKAISLILSKRCDLLVTAPIHKYAAELTGFRYSGHTDYLAKKSNAKDYAMMLVGGPLKVVLVTTHMPIRKVPKSLGVKKILSKIRLADTYFKKHFNKRKPSIAVCGLNPHAGEDGLLGDEDQKLIAPAIEAARKKKIDVFGPLVPDALFYDLYKSNYDVAICMYHDQGLIPLKMIARDESVNITLGLPFIRTSPGHGTALDIARKGIASSESMEEAVKLAVSVYNSTKLKSKG